MSKTGIKVQLVGQDGNAFAILGRVSRALRQNGHKDLVEQYQKEATSGDYNHLLAVTGEYVTVS